MTILRTNTLSGIGTNGPVFDGDLEFNSQNYIVLPKGTTSDRVGVGSTPGALRYNTDSNKVELYDGSQWTEVQSSRPDLNGGARGVFGGGLTPGNTTAIDYITISSTGNAVTFGNLTGTYRGFHAACSSSTRGVWGAGSDIAGTNRENTIDYVTIASTGNAQDFGDLIDGYGGFAVASCSSSTRGLWGSGYTAPSGPNLNTIQYITISSTGNAVDYGDLTIVRRGAAACSSSTRGLFGGGTAAAFSNVIDFVTISTLGNAQDFGDLTFSTRRDGNGACSNSTRGLWGGGYDPSYTNRIDYLNISTIGNAQDFGDLTVSRYKIGACSSATRGVFGGGYASPGTNINTIDYVTILTQGSAVDFGDLLTSRQSPAGISNAHGGL